MTGKTARRSVVGKLSRTSGEHACCGIAALGAVAEQQLGFVVVCGHCGSCICLMLAMKYESDCHDERGPGYRRLVAHGSAAWVDFGSRLA
jgi:hypothetical protein